MEGIYYIWFDLIFGLYALKPVCMYVHNRICMYTKYVGKEVHAKTNWFVEMQTKNIHVP